MRLDDVFFCVVDCIGVGTQQGNGIVEEVPLAAKYYYVWFRRDQTVFLYLYVYLLVKKKKMDLRSKDN